MTIHANDKVYYREGGPTDTGTVLEVADADGVAQHPTLLVPVRQGDVRVVWDDDSTTDWYQPEQLAHAR